MAHLALDIVVTSLCLGLAYYFYVQCSSVPKGLRLPPGPPRKFLIGNLLDLPPSGQPEYITYAQLAEKYGELVYLNIFGKSVLFVNSFEMAHEIFVKRSAIYSDRITTQMIHELTCFGNTSIITMPYGERWAQHRAIIHDLLSPKKVVEYRHILEEVTRKILCDLSREPDDFRARVRHGIGTFVMELLYGIKVQHRSDPYVELAEMTLKNMTKVFVFGAFKVDVFPMLKYLPSWFPGLEFPKAAAEFDKTYRNMMERPFSAVEQQFKSGQVTPSFVSSYLENMQDGQSSDLKEAVQQVATALYIGGIDTVDCAMQLFFLAMALHPEVQKKAQEELDRVVGKNHLPSFNDQENLPYIDAVCKELQRWQPAGPFALPHRLIQDDIIGEYFIPKGTIVMGNSRWLLRLPTKYGSDAHKFNPDRFLDKSLDLGYPEFAFGYGRRACPGRYLAEAHIFITVVSVLHMFNIAPYDEEMLRSIVEKDLFDPGVVSRPLSSHLRCKITIRPGLEKTMEQINATSVN